MAEPENHENQALASRLISAADAITNKAAAGLERDLRTAASIIIQTDTPSSQPLFPALESTLAKLANTTTDPVVREQLRRLLGEA